MSRIERNRKIYLQARRGKYALGSFNFSDASIAWGILAAAEKTKLPFMMETSQGESKYLTPEVAVALKSQIEDSLKKPVVLNLDHGKDPKYLKRVISAGYDMIHFDGSALPLKENMKIAKRIASYAHKRGVLVEGEVGYLRGASKVHTGAVEIKPEDMTQPEDAKNFVEATGVDFLAVAIGNLHGIAANRPKLDLKRLSEINASIKKSTFLVLHGGSGIPPAQIRKAIQNGVVKINVNTELRVAWRQGIEAALKKNPTEVAPSKLMPLVVENVGRVVEKKMRLFCGNN